MIISFSSLGFTELHCQTLSNAKRRNYEANAAVERKEVQVGSIQCRISKEKICLEQVSMNGRRKRLQQHDSRYRE